MPLRSSLEVPPERFARRCGSVPCANRTAMDSTDRPKAVLRAVVQFAKERDRWPSADDVQRFRRHLGGLATVKRTLAFLRDRGLLELHGKAEASRWIATGAAFELLRRPRFVPATETARLRADATLLLGPTIRKRATVPDSAALARLAIGLPVAN